MPSSNDSIKDIIRSVNFHFKNLKDYRCQSEKAREDAQIEEDKLKQIKTEVRNRNCINFDMGGLLKVSFDIDLNSLCHVGGLTTIEDITGLSINGVFVSIKLLKRYLKPAIEECINYFEEGFKIVQDQYKKRALSSFFLINSIIYFILINIV